MSEQYPDQLKIVIKQFPLKSHEFARDASQASLAAHQQGKFWEFHTRLLENHDAMDPAKIDQIAQDLNLDMDRFKTDMASAEISRIIDRDIQNGKNIGVSGTPTIFINGKQVSLRSGNEFIRKIESELKKQ